MNSRSEFESGSRLASLQKASWKGTFARIVSPAFRLHHYRTAHNRLLQNALRERDCPPVRDCGA